MTDEQLEFLYLMRSTADAAIETHHEAMVWKAEAEYYRKQYNDHLNQTIKHGEVMMGNLLLATINGNLIAKKLPDGVEPFGTEPPL